MKSVSLVNSSINGAEVRCSVVENKYIFEYPCNSNYECTDYKIHLLPGIYKFELYGASGGSHINKASSYRFQNNSCLDNEIVQKYGGNTACEKVSSNGGAGGYVSGRIKLHRSTLTFLTIGGKGIYSHNSICYNNANCFNKENLIKGGYGGGGSSVNYCFSDPSLSCGTGSGGGQTAVKFLQNDLFHRVLVSGGGGGSDDSTGTFGSSNDGSGGSGGNLTAQSWFLNGNLQNEFYADSLHGFTFGTGEAARYGPTSNPNAVQTSHTEDIAGAGGGWFGGFSSQYSNSGAGGGSSWALTVDAIIPKGLINASDMYYENIVSKEYAFTKSSGYLFEHVIHVAGIRNGHGKAIITILDIFQCETCHRLLTININSLFFTFLFETFS